MLKTYVIILMAVSFMGCAQGSKEKKSADGTSEVTTYYFIRHAEKDLSDPSDKDPKLTEEGEERAQEWKDYFKSKNIQAVYSTNYERTLNTALPTANDAGLKIINYDPNDLYDMNFQNTTQGKNVVVVGHSNTTPRFVNKVIGKDSFQEIDESEYGHLFIVTMSNGDTSVEHKEFD